MFQESRRQIFKNLTEIRVIHLHGIDFFDSFEIQGNRDTGTQRHLRRFAFGKTLFDFRSQQIINKRFSGILDRKSVV